MRIQMQNQVQKHTKLKEAYLRQRNEMENQAETIQCLTGVLRVAKWRFQFSMFAVGKVENLQNQNASSNDKSKIENLLMRISVLERANGMSDQRRRMLHDQVMTLKGSLRTVCKIKQTSDEQYIRAEPKGDAVRLEVHGKSKTFQFDSVFDSSTSLLFSESITRECTQIALRKKPTTKLKSLFRVR